MMHGYYITYMISEGARRNIDCFCAPPRPNATPYFLINIFEILAQPIERKIRPTQNSQLGKKRFTGKVAVEPIV